MSKIKNILNQIDESYISATRIVLNNNTGKTLKIIKDLLKSLMVI